MAMRTILFVPANRENMIAKAQQTPADVIILDLEDSVPPSEKSTARDGLKQAISLLKSAGKTVHVRVNHLDTGMTRDDLIVAIGGGADGLAFPKTESAQEIRALDVMIREQEVRHQVRAGTVLLFPNIESARGLLHCEEIAQASTRIAGLGLGGEDYTVDLGVPRTREGRELEYARRIVVTCAAAYRLHPLDVVFADIQDEAGLVAEAEYAKAIGYKGKYVIHPAQVGPVNKVFSPRPEDVEAARKVLTAFDEAVSQGRAAVQLDGRMVDTPVAQRARDLIAYADSLPK